MKKKKRKSLSHFWHTSLRDLKKSHEDLYVLHKTFFAHHEEVGKQRFMSEWILNLNTI